ncbi:MAG: hypothetical protein ACE5EL_01290 [Anaerolineae bacterium]
MTKLPGATPRGGLVVPAAAVAVAALVAMAGALRLADLNWMPLDPAEAALAHGAAGRGVPGVGAAPGEPL